MDEIYYYYWYSLGDDEISVVELDLYENEELDTVKAAPNRYSFWMVSKSKDKKKDFFLQVSKVFENDVYAAARLHEVAIENRKALWTDYDKLVKE